MLSFFKDVSMESVAPVLVDKVLVVLVNVQRSFHALMTTILAMMFHAIGKATDMKFWLQKVTKLALFEWGHFERAITIFKMLSVSEVEIMLIKSSSAFQRATVGLCRSKGCKAPTCQSWRSKKVCCLARVVPHAWV